MNTGFRNWCRTLMSKRKMLVVAEMLCLVAVAAVFLVANPLSVSAKSDRSGGGGGCCGGCNAGCAAPAGCAAAACAAAKPKPTLAPAQAATFDSIITTVSKTSPTDLTAQVINHVTLATLKKWPWVTVTMKVKGKTETFAAETSINSLNQPFAVLAEILPTPASVPGADTRPLAELQRDPALIALTKNGHTVRLLGVN